MRGNHIIVSTVEHPAVLEVSRVCCIMICSTISSLMLVFVDTALIANAERKLSADARVFHHLSAGGPVRANQCG